MGISGRFFQGFGSVRVWFLVFRSCSVPVPFLFRSCSVPVLFLFRSWMSGRVLVLGSRGLGLFSFRSGSGPVPGPVLVRVLVRVLVLVLFLVLSCSWSCRYI